MSVTLARPTLPPSDIDPLNENPVVKCAACGHTEQYLVQECFLARAGVRQEKLDKPGTEKLDRPGTPGNSDKPEKRDSGAIIVGACLVAAVRLARVDSAEIQKRSPRVRSAISDALAIAALVAQSAKQP